MNPPDSKSTHVARFWHGELAQLTEPTTTTKKYRVYLDHKLTITHKISIVCAAKGNLSNPYIMGLSTQALKPDSLDPDSMWPPVSSTWHTDYTHCTGGIHLIHCHAAQHAARIRNETVRRQRGLWIRIPQSASNPEPRSPKESPNHINAKSKHHDCLSKYQQFA